MREVIMGYQGEMSLKGLNRNQFESTMMKILRYRLKTVGKFRVYCTQSTFYMEPEEDDIDMDLAFERVSNRLIKGAGRFTAEQHSGRQEPAVSKIIVKSAITVRIHPIQGGRPAGGNLRPRPSAGGASTARWRRTGSAILDHHPSVYFGARKTEESRALAQPDHLCSATSLVPT